MNKKLAGIVLGVAGGLATLVSDLNHSKQIKALPTLDESKLVIKWNMRDYVNYPLQSKCEVFEAHELKGNKAVFYDCVSEKRYLSVTFITNKPDGIVDHVVVYRQKGSCEETTYHTNNAANKWQPMLEDVKKSKKLKVIQGMFTYVNSC